MDENDFLEEIEADFYGLWEIADFAFFENQSKAYIKTCIKLMVKERGVRLFLAQAGDRSNMREISSNNSDDIIDNDRNWNLPIADNNIGVFVVRKPRI